uniref:CSON004480 protein n=1 Tax=Culicoides sonorensis TaxID=179676 RepID=A0A336LTT3_CULSO
MLITGIGDEVTNFFIVLILFCVIYFGWRSTLVPHSSPVGVLIIEQNSRLPLLSSSNSTSEGQPLTRSDSQQSARTETEEITVNNVIEELENDITEFISSNENLSPSDETILASDTLAEQENPEPETREVSGEEQIIQAMDGDLVDSGDKKPNDTELRHRKVTVDKQGDSDTKTNTKDIENERELTIKLKYLNDDLKLVTAKANEAIGEFKKRYFTVELASQKLVRLVFNGHVLQPDKTLEECGLFDNCVVHCLIHNKKPSDSSNTNNAQFNSGNETSSQRTGLGSDQNVPGNRSETTPNFLNRPENGRWYLYIGMILISITLLFCWFCRINYSYLFSFYSTVGLVLMSVLFFAMIPLILLIERDVVN